MLHCGILLFLLYSGDDMACSPPVVCFGSDYPASHFDPLASLRSALQVPLFYLLFSFFRVLMFVQAGMSAALALGALTSSAAEACGVRGGIFAESYLCDFAVLQLPSKPRPPEGSPPHSTALSRLDPEALVRDLASRETQVLGVFMDGRCVFQN